MAKDATGQKHNLRPAARSKHKGAAHAYNDSNQMASMAWAASRPKAKASNEANDDQSQIRAQETTRLTTDEAQSGITTQPLGKQSQRTNADVMHRLLQKQPCKRCNYAQNVSYQHCPHIAQHCHHTHHKSQVTNHTHTHSQINHTAHTLRNTAPTHTSMHK